MVPKISITTVLAVTAAKFGVPVEALTSTVKTVELGVPRGCAMFLCIATGHTQTETAKIFSRTTSAIVGAMERLYANPMRVMLAYGIWRELGLDNQGWKKWGPLPERLPKPDEYLIREAREIRPDATRERYRPRLSTLGLNWFKLGLKRGEAANPDAALRKAMIAQAVSDVLLGCEAMKWLTEERYDTFDGITFDSACNYIDLAPGWLRSRVAKAVTFIFTGNRDDN